MPTAALLLSGMIGLAAGTYWGGAVDRRLARAIAEADRDDPNWRFEDLLAHREAVPDPANGALVVAEVVDQLPNDWPSPKPSGSATPAPGPNSPRKILDRIQSFPPHLRLDDPTIEILRAELGNYEPAVRVARTVAEFDRGRHELEPGPTLFDTPLPDTQAARNVARLMIADSAIRAHDGDIDGALDSCRAIIGVARSIGDEPFLISALVRKAIGASALNAIGRSLGQGEASEAALAAVQKALIDERDEPFFEAGIRGERAMLDELFRRITTGELLLADLSPDTSEDLRGTRRGFVFSWGKLSFDNQRAIALEWLNQAVTIASKPASLRPPLWNAWREVIRLERKKPFSAYTSNFPLLLMPAIDTSELAAAGHQAAFGAMILMVAAERQRLKVGTWPDSIASIDRAILPNRPTDPFIDQAYHMSRTDKRLLIYSVGPNFRDDRGVVRDDQSRKPDGPDDIVAEVRDLTDRGSASREANSESPSP